MWGIEPCPQGPSGVCPVPSCPASCTVPASRREADAALGAVDAQAEVGSGDGANPKEWKQLLATYERAMTRYARAMKKANAGDDAAGTEASELMVRGQELSE